MQVDTLIKIAVVDDHQLFRKGVAELINKFSEFTVILDVSNGLELIQNLKEGIIPDIVLLDIKMRVMDGYETAAWLTENFPSIKILAISMFDDEDTILKMIKLGAKGYVLKDAPPIELKEALQDLVRKGFYYSKLVSDTIIGGINKKPPKNPELSEREIEFLRYVCLQLTYKEIADKMCLAPRTIDGYRDSLFVKLNIKNKVGLAVYAMEKRYCKPDTKF